jgi:hypothetical protein
LIRWLWSGWGALLVVALLTLAVVSFLFPGRRHIALDVSSSSSARSASSQRCV